MRHSLASCPHCGHMVDTAALVQTGDVQCGMCRQVFHVALFPRALRESFPPDTVQPVMGAQDAVCFYHPASVVEAACDHCGRFLCRICTLRPGGTVYCPQCLHQAAVKSSGALSLRLNYFRQDRLALVLAFLPFSVSWCVLPALFIEPSFAAAMFFSVLLMVSLVTAPIALFTVFRQWRKAEAALARPKRRLVLAAVIATAQAGLWLIGAFGMAVLLISELGAE